MSAEKFRSDPRALSIQGGRMWVSQIDGWPPEIGDPRSVIAFGGVDRLTLTVPEARALRDWITLVLPDGK